MPFYLPYILAVLQKHPLKPAESNIARLLFIIDFDGTVAPVDTVDALLQQFASPEWTEIEEQWVRGNINSQQCMTSQLALVRGDRRDLKDFLESVRIDPSFPAFVKYVRPFGDLVVVSDGLEYPIRHALRKAGIDIPVVANELIFRDDGLAISFPYADAACKVSSGVCKCGASRTADRGRQLPVILIGDGKSDQCVARIANYVFAKGTLRSICKAEGIRHTAFETFADVLDVVREWIDEVPEPERRWPLAVPI